MKTDLRERLAAKLVALGPTYTRGERIGELVYVAGEGIESLDAYVTRYVPSRQLAVIVPILVAAVVFVLDPWTVPILLLAGPALVVLLALIGSRIRALTERREHELAWMNAQFLDVLRGLPTLKMFGRSAEQAETIETVSERAGSTTMDVLRTAFQTTLVLEWGATAATALVAIETSVRLMAGGLAFERALAVLLLAPEFFVPLRRLSAEYHVGRSGAAASERVRAILDEPVRIPRPIGVAPGPLPSRFDLRLEDVDVVYDGRTRAALSGCSFEIPHGRTVALVGASGAGKTTVANVLLRFVEPDRGRVTVQGMPLSAIDPVEVAHAGRVGPAASIAVQRHRRREPATREARGDPGGVGRGSDRRERPRLRGRPARGVRHAHRRRRRAPQRRGASALGARASVPQGRPVRDPR